MSITTKEIAKGQTVTKTLLNKRYGAHVRTVLADHLLQLSRKKGEIAKYRVLQALPTPEPPQEQP